MGLGLRVQWRIAQVVVGVPSAIWLVLLLVGFVVEPSSRLALGQAYVGDPRLLLPMVAALGFVLWVDRRLERSKPPSPSATVEPPQST